MDIAKKNPNFSTPYLDEDVYFYALKEIERHPGKKLIYCCSMYGHYPYILKEERHPPIIFPKVVEGNPQIGVGFMKVSNIFFYRTRALSNFLDELVKLERNYLILILSDHLPSHLFDEKYYIPQGLFKNIGLMLYNGKRVDIDGLYYYELPHLMYSILTGRKFCRKNKWELYKYYCKLIYQSLKNINP